MKYKDLRPLAPISRQTMDLALFDPVWVADTTNEPAFLSNYTDFYEHWGMDLSESITVNQLFCLLPSRSP
jgi:hypothetical protein